MGIKQLKIDANELTIGMYVSGLDRPWSQTPFPLQGFYIKDPSEIRELKARCHHVYIDIVKGSPPLEQQARPVAIRKNQPRQKNVYKGIRQPNASSLAGVKPIRVDASVYSTTVVPIAKEIDKARNLHREVYGAVQNVMEQLGSDGSVPVKETTKVASSMVDSVLRSPDAFTWLTRVKEKDEHTYAHAVRCAVWGILLGRHIGMPKADLDVLSMGILLKDIGKTRLPQYLLEKKELTSVERDAYEKFVEYGVDILKRTPDVKPRVMSVVKTHCERIDGSGFPDHLKADRIPFLGKIAGIVTFYDETTHPRGQMIPLSPSKAVAKLYELRDRDFQSDLVVEFIRAIGLYPTGTLVKLNTGEVAVVVEQNFKRRLKPKVMIVMLSLIHI